VLKGTIFAIFFAILVKITPEITQGVLYLLGRDGKIDILRNYWTELHLLFSIGRLMYTDYTTEIIFAVVEDRLLW